jgi:hypothetical protein
MGFNKLRVESERAAAAAKEAEARRALGPQILEDALRLIVILERTAGSSYADAVLVDDRCGYCRAPLVPVSPLPGMPHDAINRPADARSPPRRRSNQPHSIAVVPLLPAECAVCRIGASVEPQSC